VRLDPDADRQPTSARDGFAFVNGVLLTLGEARSLALRLALQHHEGGRAAANVSAKLDQLAGHGGETTVSGAKAAAAAAALGAWLAETNDDVLGERQLEPRQRPRASRVRPMLTHLP